MLYIGLSFIIVGLLIIIASLLIRIFNSRRKLNIYIKSLPFYRQMLQEVMEIGDKSIQLRERATLINYEIMKRQESGEFDNDKLQHELDVFFTQSYNLHVLFNQKIERLDYLRKGGKFFYDLQ